ncbi:MAG: putative colanic acid biosynthesis acetyltransferase [Janthinobacterium lividum]
MPPTPVAYDSSRNVPSEHIPDPYLRPAFRLGDRLKRLVWGVVHALLYRTTPAPLHAWRAFLLRCFGARTGPNCHFYPASRVWAPWNLICEEQVTAANGVEIYNPAPMYFGSHAILSQGAYLCGATHDYNKPDFPLLAYEMHFGAYCWICARASVGPGVQVGEGAVLGLAGVATRSLEPWTVYGGNPAVALKARTRTHPGSATGEQSA